MNKDKDRNIGDEILSGLKELKAGKPNRVTKISRISKNRENIGLSQAEFAKLLGVSVRTLQEWEQGRRIPSGPSRTLLRIANNNPKALLEAAS